MPPVRTTLLLIVAQIVGGSTPATHTLPTAMRWSVEISASPAAPPVIDGDEILIVLQSGVVAARRISDGTPVWEVPLSSDRPIAIDGGRVYVATSDQIVALNVANGSKAWSLPSPTVTAPLVAQGGWVIAATDKALTAFRSVDGSQVWTRDLAGATVMPTMEGDNLYVPLEDGRLFALDLLTGKDRWLRSYEGPLSEVLAFSDRILFGTGDKFFFCLRAADGERQWERVRLGSLVRGRPTGDEHHIYVASMDNTLRAYRRSNGALLWHPSVPFRPTTGPVLIDSAVVIAGNASELRSFDTSNGQPAGQITLEGSLVMPPAFGKSEDATVMAAFTGTLNGQWKLVLTGPPAPAPAAPRE
ncbi:MAG: PQQ-binding-like beta-propeller repeat protein [Vicinamibacterales bacterium]